VTRGLNTDEVAEPDAFAIEATIAAFTAAEPWLEELRAYIQQNKAYATDTIHTGIPGPRVVSSHATYLLWIDCDTLTDDTTELCRFLRHKTGLVLSEGAAHGGDGKRFIRMNVACPRTRLDDGPARLWAGVDAYRAA
jgi:cystathionine beta-lyase